jgi:hypothetical protein
VALDTLFQHDMEAMNFNKIPIQLDDRTTWRYESMFKG